MEQKHPRILTTGEAAHRLGVSVTRVRQLCASNALPARITPGGWRFIEGEAVEALRLRRLHKISRRKSAATQKANARRLVEAQL